MAITLQITDGTDTVDFHDTTNLYLGAAFQMNVGEGAVTEQIIAGWANGLTADQKAVISKKFNRLIRKAILHYREQRIDRAVWLVWKPDDQTDTQYAKVMGGGEVEIVKHTIGGWGGGYFNPTIVREGAWRDTAPDGTAGATVISAVTRYNKEDADGNNELSISNAGTNDVPSLLEFTISNNATFDNILIATKRFANATDADNFKTHFNPSEQVTAHATPTDTSGPGDVKIDLTSTDTISWKIADTILPDYYGAYSVYCRAYTSTTNDTWTVKYTDDNQSGTAVNVKTGSTNNLIYLGDFNIPAVDLNPYLTLATSMDLQINLVCTEASGTDTFTFLGLWFVPIDIPPFWVTAPSSVGTADQIIIDGVNQLVYQKAISGGGATYTIQFAPIGRFPTGLGGEENRFYLFCWEGTDYQHNDTFTVTVKEIDRFLGLRGNT